MCDQDMVSAMPIGEARVTRRDFNRLGAVAGVGVLAAGASGPALAQRNELGERSVAFDAPGGRMDGLFIFPHEGKHPAVVLWPDIAGLRDAKYAMGRELARAGYAVLVANPYYRSVEGVQFEDFDDWRGQGGFEKVGPWMALNTPAAIAETMVAVVGWLDAQDEVDTDRGIGMQGYCMTGSWTIRGAAAVPARVKAAASFHGGGLVGEGPDAPINLLASLADDARVLIAIARNDDATAPGDKDALRAAADAAGLNAEIEVYAGDHGWTVLDSPVYDFDEGDRAWARLLALYEAAL
jgi:carboxymethylenebutenolidase